ncbi:MULTISPECIES: hypothetical protein [unclassified Streptomyces]|uniref:hypothetical protein n=1 Tax=unclassified Streptomyces TaxID=2593676 RepID=UPI0033A48578
MQNTDTDRCPCVNVTRIHSDCFQTLICQPSAGVADTSPAEVAPRSKTTRPPEAV